LARVSINLLSPCVYDVDGLTVAVQPGMQIVLSTFACVTSAKYAPGGSANGDRRSGGAPRSVGVGAAASEADRGASM